MFNTLFLLLKTGKLGKILLTCGTMLLTIWIYQMRFGWKYSVGFVFLIFVHEMGHYIAARRRGLDVGAPTFIPFIGAWIELKQKPHNVETEAYVGLAGPFVGTLGALVFYFAGRNTNDSLLLSLAYSGFMINLFNLIPLSPLDGGRITAVLSPRIWFVGVPLLVAFFVYRPSPILVLIGILAIPSLRAAFKYDPHAPENKAYYEIKPDQRLFYASYYLLLVGFLALMTYDLDLSLRGMQAI